MSTLGEVVVKLTADIGGITKNLEKVQSSLQDLGSKMTSVGKTLTAGVTTPILGLGTAAILTVSKFDDSMSKVSAISGATGKDLEALRNQAKELGASTAFSASQAADGMAFLAQAGFKTHEVMSAMPSMLNLASAGNLDLARTADIASNIMSGFGIAATEAGRVADVLAQAASSSNVDISMLGETMKYAAPVAKAFGMSLEEAAAIAGKMGDAGIQGSEAGTALRAALVRLSDPPKDAADALKKLGVATTDLQGNMLPIGQILKQMEQGMAGLSESEKLAAASAIFGQEAMAGWLAVLDVGSDTLSDFTKELENSNGRAEQMATTMQDNIGGAFRSFMSAVEGLAISFGEVLSPYVRKVAEQLTGLVSKFSEMDSGTKKIIIVIGSLVAAIGPVLLGLGMMATAIGAISSPVLIAVGAIAGFIAIIATLWNTNEEFRNKIVNLWQSIKDFGVRLWSELGGQITSLFKNAMDTVVGVLNGAIDIITGIFNVFVGLFTGDWKKLDQGLRSIWKGLWDAVISLLNGAYNVLKTVFQSQIEFIKGSWQTAKSITETTWNQIYNSLAKLFNQILKEVQEKWKQIVSTLQGAWDMVTNGFNSLVDNAWNWGRNLVNMFVDGFWSAFHRIYDAVESAARTISNFLGFSSPTKKGPASNSDEWSPNFVQMFADGITDSLPKLQKAVNGMALNLNAVASPAVTVASVRSPQTYNPNGNVSSPVQNFNYTIYADSYEDFKEKMERDLSRRGVKF